MSEQQPAEEPPKITYRGNCICADFIFEASMPEIKQINACNCSCCTKKGYVLTSVKKEDFKLVKGDVKDLTSYSRNGAMNHMFCPKCGIALLADYDQMPDKIFVSVRALQGPVDIWNMPKNPFDGKNYGSKWVPHKYEGPEPSLELEGGEVYHGSCHCGDVRVAMRAKPVETASPEEQRIIECNCSLCQRSGALWIYPHHERVVVQFENEDKVTRYARRHGTRTFCKRCGVWIYGQLDAKTDEEFAKLPDRVREYLADKRHERPVNLRIFEGIDFQELKTQQFDGYNFIQPLYVNP